MMRVRVLGCGASGGVPVLAQGWGACDPANPRNRRLRPSILVENGPTRILVDTSPDLREQLLAAEVDRLDAVLFTHAHADHLHGLDDLRPLNRVMNRAIPCWGSDQTLAGIESRFGYALAPLPEGVTFYYKPTLDAHRLDGPFAVGEIDVVSFEQDHGWAPSTGFRFGRFAYSTDAIELNDAAFEALAGVEVWMVGCLQFEPHDTHAHLDKALAWIDRVGPRRAILTHLSHRLDYEELRSRCPAHVVPAYDGMVIEIDD